MFRAELRRSFCNAFFFLPIQVLSLKLIISNKKRGRKNKHTWRAQYNKELYAAFGKNESLLKKRIIIFQLDNNIGAKNYFTGEVSGSSPG